MGYSRIVKWCYYPISILRDTDSLEDKYVEPNIPVKHWYAKMCKEWLRAHGIRCTGTVSELRDIIEGEKRSGFTT